ncbi:unnamed protein product [Didymodactylos carnosus]|uniref:Uncharacterized protein n=1 Tax=Didymodactylos carnosus TaxID=1234261 RepID=A0A816ETD5_9BILA|nr:unnamed protein product [Didymodactylos carnosus]CAF4587336.1 unnamed protein product [Didymodactylos carnosus]
MLKSYAQSKLCCGHNIPADIACRQCAETTVDYHNRPLYAPMYIPLNEMNSAIDNSTLQLPTTFYVPVNKQMLSTNTFHTRDECVEINTNKGIVRLPRSSIVQRNQLPNNCHEFPGDFKKHAHRFARSFGWRTKQDIAYQTMAPLPKLVKKPGYVEICCKSKYIFNLFEK